MASFAGRADLTQDIVRVNASHSICSLKKDRRFESPNDGDVVVVRLLR